ncbi:glutamate-5-semialdehyde dehydrogenase, partial [uncultured Faecalibaculum sp.]
ATLSAGEKNDLLLAAATQLEADAPRILAANAMDVQRAKDNGMAPGLVDRLTLTPERIAGIAAGIREVAALPDPIGRVESMEKRPNGLMIGRKRVPLGVVGVIYEARPNVTADVFALTFKTGNAVILKGGRDAAQSNEAIVQSLQSVLPVPDALQLIRDNARKVISAFMKLRNYVDVLIPRGGKGLIQATVNNATIPVIETGTGNCHAYIDETADKDMAIAIVNNAKTQRIGVCNALESLVVHRSQLPMLKELEQVLDEHQVQIRADQDSLPYFDHAVPASEEDFGTEYLDYILSVKTVDSVEEAIGHINAYSTGHSETIITQEYASAQKFLDQVDSAAVYVNASTRFTDGNEFGFGAEIGISTQKLHARGPMGLEALTSSKFIIYGNGQVR